MTPAVTTAKTHSTIAHSRHGRVCDTHERPGAHGGRYHGLAPYTGRTAHFRTHTEAAFTHRNTRWGCARLHTDTTAGSDTLRPSRYDLSSADANVAQRSLLLAFPGMTGGSQQHVRFSSTTRASDNDYYQICPNITVLTLMDTAQH
jgi:hypothetical protein